MEDQGVTAVREALRNVPGISLAAGEAGAQGDSLTLRGFNARNDFYLDGMRDFGSYYRDPFNLNEIEVLKGPASILFGRGSTGGVINQVSKQPQLAPITAAHGDGRHRSDVPLHHRYRPAHRGRAELGVPPQPDGQPQWHVGARRRRVPSLRHRPVGRLRHRHRHAADPQLLPPAGRQRSGLRAAMVFRLARRRWRGTISTASPTTTSCAPRSISAPSSSSMTSTTTSRCATSSAMPTTSAPAASPNRR